MVWTCVSPTIGDVEHLFTGLLAIVRLFKSSAHRPFLNLIVWWVGFLLLGSMNSFYILRIHPLSDTRFEIIFSNSGSCLYFQYFAWNLFIGKATLEKGTDWFDHL